ncbi:MAG: hypothetical protein OQK51_22430 [Kangiellaceae bacterium]|nr:hypothetical protein [Kangiellaceae bacterium]
MKELFKLLVGVVLIVMMSASTYSYAGSSRDTQAQEGSINGCPEGFSPIPSGLACAADNLTFNPVMELPPPHDCPPGFERVPGVRFCVAANLTIDIPQEMMLLEAVINGDCPEGFSRPVGSRICVADNLVLDTVEREVKLVKYIPNCPEGFHQPVGVRFCIAENLKPKELPMPSLSDCPPGFTRPPGVRFCVATNVLDLGNDLENPLGAPEGDCPEGWHRGPNGFCMPENKTTKHNDERSGGEYDLIKIENTLKSSTDASCAKGEYDLWWDMPVFDKAGKIVGFVKTRSCAAQSVSYMPNSAN